MDRLRKQAIKSVIDILLLAELRKGEMSGYDAISTIHNKFGVLLSSGTIYSHLYSLERDNLIEGSSDSKKRVYTLTEKGEDVLETVGEANAEILETLKSALTT